VAKFAESRAQREKTQGVLLLSTRASGSPSGIFDQFSVPECQVGLTEVILSETRLPGMSAEESARDVIHPDWFCGKAFWRKELSLVTGDHRHRIGLAQEIAQEKWRGCCDMDPAAMIIRSPAALRHDQHRDPLSDETLR